MPLGILVQMICNLVLSLVGLPGFCQAWFKGPVGIDGHQAVEHQFIYIVSTCVGGVHDHEGVPVAGLGNGDDLLTRAAAAFCLWRLCLRPAACRVGSCV